MKMELLNDAPVQRQQFGLVERIDIDIDVGQAIRPAPQTHSPQRHHATTTEADERYNRPTNWRAATGTPTYGKAHQHFIARVLSNWQ